MVSTNRMATTLFPPLDTRVRSRTLSESANPPISDGWRIDRVVLTRDGPPRQWLRLRSGHYLIGYYRTVEELADALSGHGYSLADFIELPDARAPDGQAP
jgi:hypothetical protein